MPEMKASVLTPPKHTPSEMDLEGEHRKRCRCCPGHHNWRSYSTLSNSLAGGEHGEQNCTSQNSPVLEGQGVSSFQAEAVGELKMKDSSKASCKSEKQKVLRQESDSSTTPWDKTVTAWLKHHCCMMIKSRNMSLSDCKRCRFPCRYKYAIQWIHIENKVLARIHEGLW